MYRTLHPIPTDGRKLKVCGYARVSTDKFEAEMSLDNQISYYTTLILENPDWDYCGVYADEGITGTSIIRREQFRNMVAKAMKGMIDIILVKSISRFGRNITDVISAINDLRTMGVEVFFEKENISTLDASSTVALAMYSKLAEAEIESMSQNMTWSVEKRIKKGKYRIPVEEMLGYDYDEKGNLVIVEEEAKIIREIFELYVEKVSLLSIARIMESKGYKTGIGRNTWNEKTVTRILINEKYVGDAHLQKVITSKMSSGIQHVNRGEKESYYIKDGHPGIISRELWDKACAIREARRIKYNTPKGMPKAAPHVETGFGVCPYCGGNFFIKRLSNAKSGIKYTLTCNSNRSTLTCRESESVFIEDLKDIVLQQINILKANPTTFKKELQKAYKFDEKPIRTKLDYLNSEIEEYRNKLRKIQDKKDESYDLIRDEINLHIENLTKEKNQCENALLTQLDSDSKIKEIIAELNKLSAEDREQNYRGLFKKVVIKSRTDLTFIVGNDKLNGLDLLNLPKVLKGTKTIKVRGQFYLVNFGICVHAN
ncbi:MAG: recombinase family protein [Bacilli bacterium]|nr:recombinase family protein [Bacilli bacterium]